MKMIRTIDVVITYFLVIAFGVFLTLGFFKLIWFVPAALALAAYFVIKIIMLRCPYCGGAVDLDRLLRGAIKKQCHCPLCGSSIVVGRRRYWSEPQNKE